MCGIAGVVGGNVPDLDQILETMLSTIEHRGPDDKGTWVVPGIGLGMQRLSIIDIADGHQPMISETGNVIVFNGEIYNYRNLRDELIALGISLSSHSDTEVILRGYEVWGIEVIDRLVGMFAIALFDAKDRVLHLVRDRLGKKPLYCGPLMQGSAFGFASELKALHILLNDEKAVLNEQSVLDYLAFRFIPGPNTIWKSFRKLPPGHRLVVNVDSLEIQEIQYWKIEVNSNARRKTSPSQIQRQFDELFLSAVQMRLEASDVPVGVLLSGGLDSSAVVAAAAELGHSALETFSIGFADGGNFSELQYARTVADFLGTNHREVVLTQQEFLDLLPKFAAISDEPLGDLASIPLFKVCELAAQHVKVALTGEGADEVLGGYDFDKMAQLLNRIKMAHTAPKFIRNNVAQVLKSTRVAGVLRGEFRDVPKNQSLFISRDWASQDLKNLWIKGSNFQFPESRIEEWYDAATSIDPLDKIMQVYLGDWLVEDLLMKADKMSMANSLELRNPFLDHRIVEFVAHLPNSFKVGVPFNWTTKRLLRNFARTRIPAVIIDRPKLGFPVPAYNWLTSELSLWASERLLGNDLLSTFCDRDTMSRTVDLAKQGDRTAQRRTWNLIVLDHWLEAWT